MPKEHPILFSTPMVKAILEGRKTTTRRAVAKNNCKPAGFYGYKFSDLDFNDVVIDGIEDFHYLKVALPVMDTRHHIYPKWEVGDILWVKETFFESMNMGFIYKADGYNSKGTTGIHLQYSPEFVKWKPSLFMPRKAARILLQITGIKVERLQDISPGDACDEGVEYWNIDREALEDGELVADFMNYTWTEKQEADPNYEDRWFPTFANPVASFRTLWQSINGPESWNENPFVWCISFKKL